VHPGFPGRHEHGGEKKGGKKVRRREERKGERTFRNRASQADISALSLRIVNSQLRCHSLKKPRLSREKKKGKKKKEEEEKGGEKGRKRKGERTEQPDL